MMFNTKEIIVNKDVKIGGDNPLVFIGGPCAIESEEHALYMAKEIKKIADRVGIKFVYKSCFDKESRSSLKSFRGVGPEKGLKILQKIKDKFTIPITSDFHNAFLEKHLPEGLSLKSIDLVQIPEYMSKQTSILLAAGGLGNAINVKKGTFMSPWTLKNSVKKIESTGNTNILLTDRGTFFGYNMLISDMRCFKTMRETGYPVCYDATHSVQLPGARGTMSGGQREFIPTLVRAAIGAGIDALFMEVHHNPDEALGDPATVLNLKDLEPILKQAKRLHEFMRKEKDIMGVE